VVLKISLFPALAALVAAGLLTGCATAPLPPPSPPDMADNAYSAYLSGRFAAQQHDLADAARYYAQSLKSDPGNSDLLALAFYYASTAGEFEKAADFAKTVVQTRPDNSAARMTLAVAALKHKDYPAVRRNLAASAKGPFTTLTASLFDGWAAAASGNAADAAADMKALAGQSGAEGLAAFHAALIADFLGHDDNVDTLYSKALMLNPGSPRVVEAYGVFLERAGRSADARKFYAGLNGSPALAPLAVRGLARLDKGEKPAAMIGSAAEGVAEGLFGIAASLGDGTSTDASILYLRMALYLRPDLALADILLADRYEGLHKYDEAIAIYDRVDKASPYYRMAAMGAALDDARMGRSDVATSKLRVLADADPTDSNTWMALGDAYRNAGKFDEAVSAYDRAEKAIPKPAKKDWSLYYSRAMAQDKAGHWQQAEADAQTGLKLSPDQPELLNYLAYSWIDRGLHYTDALTMLEKAQALRPYDGYIVDSVGWAYYHLGRYKTAVRTLEAAILLVPGDSTINDHLGDALWKMGRKMEARYQWNHALAFASDDGEKSTLEQKLKDGLVR
jgi:tetratricopeptide (TPR) repeat protein